MPGGPPSKYWPATQDQALGYLTEECGEVLSAVGKSERWGLDSSNPELPEAERETNADWLLRELNDLEVGIHIARCAIRTGETPIPCPTPELELSIEGAYTLRDLFCGIGIETDQGRFGIAERDGGIEVLLNGELVWSSSAESIVAEERDAARVDLAAVRMELDRLQVRYAETMAHADTNVLVNAVKAAIPESEHPAEETLDNWAWQIRNLGEDRRSAYRQLRELESREVEQAKLIADQAAELKRLGVTNLGNVAESIMDATGADAVLIGRRKEDTDAG